jgi:ribosome-associated protein
VRHRLPLVRGHGRHVLADPRVEEPLRAGRKCEVVALHLRQRRGLGANGVLGLVELVEHRGDDEREDQREEQLVDDAQPVGDLLELPLGDVRDQPADDDRHRDRHQDAAPDDDQHDLNGGEVVQQRAGHRAIIPVRPAPSTIVAAGSSCAVGTLNAIDPKISPLTPEALAQAIAAHAGDKKAADVVELDVRGVLGYTDFFLVCSGNTSRQTKGIHDGIHLALKDEHGILPRRVEGLREARWILMDYLDVVVHIFTPETRDFYRLEQLWGEVPARVMDPVGS